MRLAVVVALSCSLIGLAMADPAKAAITKTTDIRAQGLGPALKELARDRGFQVVFRSEVVGTVRTNGVHGNLTTSQALTMLLEGTNLSYSYLDENTVTILPRGDSGSGAATPPDGRITSGDPKQGDTWERQKSPTFRLAQLDQRSSSTVSTVASTGEASGLEEIVVTAQKREQRLIDVPIPVSVLDANTLAVQNQLELKDYYSQFPGLTFTTVNGGYNVLTIRGLTTGGIANSTVGVVIDDVPFGGSVLNTGGWKIPDIDPSDLAQIEVLRGPQGTLYGANSMGGLLKYVTADPVLDNAFSRVQVGTSAVAHGDSAGYYASGSFNAPLSDSVALRGSVFGRQDPGYISNAETGQKDLNTTDVHGGHGALLWRPTEDLSLKFSGLVEHTQTGGDGYADVGTGLSTYENARTRGAGTFVQDLTALSSNIGATIDKLDLKSITAYISSKSLVVNDLPAFDGFANLYGFSNAIFPKTFSTSKYSQELRASITPISNVDVLVGAFYTHEQGNEVDQFFATSNDSRSLSVNPYSFYVPATYEEYALFEDVTLHLGQKFQVQLGSRESHYKLSTSSYQVADSVFAAAIGAPTVVNTPTSSTSATPLTYMVSPQYRFANDFMVYARFASGYRPGGSNPTLAQGQGVPPSFGPDTTHDYEVGLKGEFFDRKLSVDASVYYINWANVQLASQTVVNCCYLYTSNGGSAKSQGVELSMNWLPMSGTRIGGWVSVNDAVLTKTLGATSTIYGQSGDRLPYSSPFSAHADFSQDFPLGWSTGFVGASFDYVGKRDDVFSSKDPGTGLPAQPRLDFPSYTKFDIKGGFRFSRYVTNLYVNNVADRRGVLAGGYQSGNTEVQFIQPRTVGVNITASF